MLDADRLRFNSVEISTGWGGARARIMADEQVSNDRPISHTDTTCRAAWGGVVAREKIGFMFNA